MSSLFGTPLVPAPSDSCPTFPDEAEDWVETQRGDVAPPAPDGRVTAGSRVVSATNNPNLDVKETPEQARREGWGSQVTVRYGVPTDSSGQQDWSSTGVQDEHTTRGTSGGRGGHLGGGHGRRGSRKH